MKKIEIMIGQKFNMLTVIEELPIGPNGRVLKCECECGIIKEVLLPHLIRSLIKSCGCYRKKIRTKHGMWRSREYSTWENMLQRCTNPKAKKYHLYGGRNITVCDRWSSSFQSFYEDMGPRPINTTLDRIDSNKGYFKENCKWSNPREQLVNVRSFQQLIKLNDIVKTTEEWLRDLHVDRDVFKSRVLRGLGFKEALLCDVDIIVLDVVSKQQSVYTLHGFLTTTKFRKEVIIDLIDSDHKNPYFGYLIRYLIGFKEWPVEYV